MLQLRYYQDDAVESVDDFFQNNPTGNPILALPTGTGKSLIIAEMIRKILSKWPGQRILMLTHVKELIDQNGQKLLTQWPQAPLGIFSAGLGKKEPAYPVVYAGIQSVVRFLRKNPKGLGMRHLVIIDECHLLSPTNETQYNEVITKLQELNPQLRVIGLTATPYRMKSGMLTDGEGIFTHLAFDLCSLESFNKLVLEGYICPLIPKKTDITFDTSRVNLLGGEFNGRQLQEAVDTEENNHRAVQEMIAQGKDRRSWLIFASGIDHAEHICSILQSYGITAATSHSKIDKKENTRRIEAFKNFEIQCLVNMNKLTTGFDHPGIDLIGMMRPTRSTSLWVQMLGRGTRPSPGKENCLVLDFAGNTLRLGPINDPVIPTGRRGTGGTGEAPVRICDHCGMYNHASARFCLCCGEEFPRRQQIQATASTHDLIRGNDGATLAEMLEAVETPTVKDYNISSVSYHKYQKSNNRSSIPTMRVTYQCGVHKRFYEWVPFDHVGNMRAKAEDWWIRRTGQTDSPPDVETAVYWAPHCITTPRSITVRETAKTHPQIVDVNY